MSVVEDLGRAAGADAVAAELDAADRAVEVANAAGRLELDVPGGCLAHQGQVGLGRAAGAVAGGGLHVVGPVLAADLAEPDLLLVVQVAVLEDHLDDRAALVGDADDRRDVVGDGLPLAAEDLADVHHHVQLRRPVVQGVHGLGDLDEGRVAAVGEPDGRAHRHAAARRGSPSRARRRMA